MSTSAKKEYEGSQHGNAAADWPTEENASPAATTATAATGATTEGRTSPASKLAAPEKKAAPAGRKSRRVPSKKSRAQSTTHRGSPASLPSTVVQQATTQGIPSKRAATADAPAVSTTTKTVKATGSPGQQISEEPAPSQRKAAASTSPAGQKIPDKDTMNALNALLNVRAEPRSSVVPSPQTAARSKFSLTYDVKVLIAALFIAIILGVAFFLQPKSKRQLERFCTTNGCEEHRRRIENQLDKSVDPCDDFYAYVCGRWEPRKEFHLSRSELSDMFLSWLYKLPATLEKGVVQFPVGKKVAGMFEKCRTQKGSQVGIMKGFMQSRGIVWPESPVEPVPPAKALFDLSFNWNVHLWFTLKVLPAIPNKMPRRIFLAPNQLMLLWKAMINQIPKQSFQRVYTDLFKIFANDKSRKPDTDEAFQTHDILEYVFDTLVPSCPCKAHTPGLFSLSDIDKSSPIPIGEHIMNMTNAVLGIDPPFTMDDLVLVSDMSHFDNILRIFGRVNDTTLLRHLAFLFVQVYAVVAYPTGVLVVVHGSEHRAEEERPRFCAGQIEPSYKLLVAAMASVAHFSEQERRHIDEQLEGVVQVAVDKTWAASWLDNKTKQVASQKLKNVRTVVWPSDKFLTPEALEEVYVNFVGSASSFADFWIDTRRSQRLLFGSEAAEQELLLGDNTRLPYVEYIRVLNRLSVSLGALAAPLYYPKGTKAMLHGGVLFLYARALISAIDNEGVMVNPQGEIVSSWLSEDLQETYEQRTLGCLPGNVSIFPEIPAMEVAYEAFKRSLEDNDTQLSEDLTEEKVFFITACLSTCAMTPADNLYGGDCNKAVVNFEPFARAFNCPVGSKMNPATKCTFYD